MHPIKGLITGKKHTRCAGALDAMNSRAMQTLVLCLFLCLVKGQLQPSSCDGDACWRPPAALLPESEQTTEEEAVVTLSCYLACVDSTAEVCPDH